MKILYIIVAILILLLMITIHEFGHYIAGKLLGFKIDEFAIGFGPKLFSKTKKNGEVFSIRALPLGGFCAFAGETDEEAILAPEKIKSESKSEGAEVREQSNQEENQATQTDLRGKKFNEQPPWKRIIVLMAGGVFNLISAVIFAFIFIVAAGASTPNVATVYQSIDNAAVCALESGDKILEVDGKEIDFNYTLSDALEGKKEGDVLDILVLRDGQEMTVSTSIREYDTTVTNEDGTPITAIGMGVGLLYERATVGEAFKYCVPYTAELSWMILGAFGDLITGKVPISEVSGPIGTVNQMANYGMQNWTYFLLLMPLIAANLGLFNLFPIPALDGAKVVFTVIEWIRGKPIDQNIEGMIHFIGLIVLLALVVILDVYNLIFV
ncbi:MAG: site-2 protease family protein [Clostridia bacterium]|nr:site-2 protease family protein [Clostridia bacterium]